MVHNVPCVCGNYYKNILWTLFNNLHWCFIYIVLLNALHAFDAYLDVVLTAAAVAVAVAVAW